MMRMAYPTSAGRVRRARWAELLAADGQARDEFGHAVAISGAFAVIGAPEDDDQGTDAGAAYVFELQGSAWVQRVKLLPPSGSHYDGFGSCVAIDGDVLVVGSALDDSAAMAAGAVYVYSNNAGNWVLQQKLVAADAQVGDRFGADVAVSGDTIAVGADLDDDRGTDAGAAYVFPVQRCELVSASQAACPGWRLRRPVRGPGRDRWGYAGGWCAAG